MELQNNPHLERSFRIARMVAVLMMAGQLIYIVVIEALHHLAISPAQAVLGEYPQLKPLFYGIAIFSLVLSFWLRSRLLGQGEELHRMVSQILDPQLRQQRMIKANQVAMSVAGTPGFLAVALFLLGGGRSDCYPLIALALIGQAKLFPTRQAWEQWYAQRNAFR